MSDGIPRVSGDDLSSALLGLRRNLYRPATEKSPAHYNKSSPLYPMFEEILRLKSELRVGNDQTAEIYSDALAVTKGVAELEYLWHQKNGDSRKIITAAKGRISLEGQLFVGHRYPELIGKNDLRLILDLQEAVELASTRSPDSDDIDLAARVNDLDRILYEASQIEDDGPACSACIDRELDNHYRRFDQKAYEDRMKAKRSDSDWRDFVNEGRSYIDRTAKIAKNVFESMENFSEGINNFSEVFEDASLRALSKTVGSDARGETDRLFKEGRGQGKWIASERGDNGFRVRQIRGGRYALDINLQGKNGEFTVIFPKDATEQLFGENGFVSNAAILAKSGMEGDKWMDIVKNQALYVIASNVDDIGGPKKVNEAIAQINKIPSTGGDVSAEPEVRKAEEVDEIEADKIDPDAIELESVKNTRGSSSEEYAKALAAEFKSSDAVSEDAAKRPSELVATIDDGKDYTNTV